MILSGKIQKAHAVFLYTLVCWLFMRHTANFTYYLGNFYGSTDILLPKQQPVNSALVGSIQRVVLFSCFWHAPWHGNLCIRCFIMLRCYYGHVINLLWWVIMKRCSSWTGLSPALDNVWQFSSFWTYKIGTIKSFHIISHEPLSYKCGYNNNQRENTKMWSRNSHIS